MASYGARGLGMRGAAGKLDAALTDAGVEHDVKEYPSAGHSFRNRHNSGPLALVEKVAHLAQQPAPTCRRNTGVRV